MSVEVSCASCSVWFRVTCYTLPVLYSESMQFQQIQQLPGNRPAAAPGCSLVCPLQKTISVLSSPCLRRKSCRASVFVPCFPPAHEATAVSFSPTCLFWPQTPPSPFPTCSFWAQFCAPGILRTSYLRPPVEQCHHLSPLDAAGLRCDTGSRPAKRGHVPVVNRSSSRGLTRGGIWQAPPGLWRAGLECHPNGASCDPL